MGRLIFFKTIKRTFHIIIFDPGIGPKLGVNFSNLANCGRICVSTHLQQIRVARLEYKVSIILVLNYIISYLELCLVGSKNPMN